MYNLTFETITDVNTRKKKRRNVIILLTIATMCLQQEQPILKYSKNIIYPCIYIKIHKIIIIKVIVRTSLFRLKQFTLNEKEEEKNNKCNIN